VKRIRIEVESSAFHSTSILQALLSVPGIDKDVATAAVETVVLANELTSKVVAFAPYTSPVEKQKVIALGLLVRLIDVAEVILLLATSGGRQDLQSLFRVFLDAYFLFANTCSDAEFVPRYLRTDEVNRLKLLNSAAKQNDQMFDRLKGYATHDLRNGLASRIRTEGIQALSSQRHAQDVNCSHIYDSMYRLTSATVHSSPRCLEQYLKAGSEDLVTGITRGASVELANRSLNDTAFLLLTALRGTCELFEHDVEMQISALETVLNGALPQNLNVGTDEGSESGSS